ncbi:uncharacterized protein LOC121868996 isoform X2 [Homarus americanus]|uniref:uncharacterized protein LOC121868996 isoform X2 n=1 Tax=Homarus americanus TaxID=6706 RepID=UPI001C46791A|nr:uncharacterized protein LOC121868996 isoform X2 [Homarus americanus]
MEQLLGDYQHLFSDVPQPCSLVELNVVQVGDPAPTKQTPYRMSPSKKQSKMHSSMLVFLLVVAVAAAAPAAPGAAGGIPPAVNAFIPAAAKAFIPSPEDIKALAALHTTAAPPPGAPAPASFKFAA